MISLSKILLEDKDILIPRGLEERRRRAREIAFRKALDYIRSAKEGEWLDLGSSCLTTLPSELRYIKGDLFLDNNELETLPDFLTVEGNLILDGNPFKSIPKGLKVHKVLSLFWTPLGESRSKESIQDEIERKGGFIGKGIFSR